MNKERLQTEMISAMKEGAEIKKNILKTLIAELERKGKNPTEDEIFKEIKKIITNLSTFKSENGEIEIEILKSYLPSELTDDELIEIISKIKADNPNIVGGKLIGLCFKEVNGRADSERVKKLI